jgi:hypothetical protein
MESKTENINVLRRDSYWNEDDTVWKQPPTKIKHGDLVDVEYGNGTVFGRYIGKGMGVVEFYNYAVGVTHHIGKVRSRGLDRNPRLISDKDLFDYIDD